MTLHSPVLGFSLGLLITAGACSPKTDIVARRALVIDAAPDIDAKPPEPDTGIVRDATPEEDATVVDAEVADASDTGMPMLGDCKAKLCDSIDSRVEFCAAERPPSVSLGDSCDPTGLPRFQYAVCSCSDLVTNASFHVESLGAAAPTGAASIGVNDGLKLSTDTSIDGSIYVAGQYVADAPPRVTGSVVQSPAPRCDCDPMKLLDTGTLIAARQLDNDNADPQLTAATLDGFAAGTVVTLDCGRYYFNRVGGTGPLTIEARGRVALFIGGDVGVNGDFTLTLQNGATAEIYVLGNMRVTGRLELSTSNDGNRVLLVVNGSGTIDLEDATIDGSIYAPRAELVTRGPFEAHGSLFVERANFDDAARVRFEVVADAQARCRF